MRSKVIQKLGSNQAVREALTTYYKEITKPGRDNRFNKVTRFGGFSSVTGWVNHDQETRKLQRETIARVRDALAKSNPASLIHENEIGRVLQETLSRPLDGKTTVKNFLENFFTEYEKYLEKAWLVFLPCYSCILPLGTQSLNLGSVSIVLSGEVLKEAQKNLSLRNRSNIKMFWDDDCNKLKCQIGEMGHIKTLPSSNVFWRVDANASPENLKEEALWSINVTLSLIRIFGTNWSVMYPQSLDLEKDPVIEDRDFGVDPLIMTEGNIRIPGQKRIGTYEISAKSLPLFRSEWFQQIAIQLSEARENTLAYRVRDALGWLGRGRQESDRALRLLFFFTAIEAMLSSEDKGAPVTDTIARYGSIIASPTGSDRFGNHNWIKDLYKKRSETVHRGLRNSLWGHSIDAQEVAEVVAWQILEKCDLTQEYSQFHKDLKKASFGSDWEPTPSTLAKPEHTHA